MKLFDSHCHLDLPAFDPDREEILKHCKRLGFTGLVIPAITRAGWASLAGLCDHHPDLLHPAFGLHPMYLQAHHPRHLAELARWTAHPRTVAVGEIGLDFHIPQPDREAQRHYFEAQLEIAEEQALPVILHVRKAHDPVLKILRQYRLKGGVVHAFNGSLQQAERYLELGFKFGFGGALTYPRAKRLHRLAQALPPESLLLETDAPDMAPAAHHGKRNRPDYLPEIVETLARLRGESPEQIAGRTTRNALALFLPQREETAP